VNIFTQGMYFGALARIGFWVGVFGVLVMLNRFRWPDKRHGRGLVIFILSLLCGLEASVMNVAVKAENLKPLVVAQETMQQERRVALVIGNGSYGADKDLNNPTNDAADLAAALRELKFEVILVTDANKQRVDEALDQFYRELRLGGVGLFYYAGHGIQVEEGNYLIPTGARISQESDIRYQAIPLGQIVKAMEGAKNRLNIVLIDACRNNPYHQSWWRSESLRGLAPFQAGRGTFISFSTSPGKAAADGSGRNSPYMAGLLKHIKILDLPIEQMFKKVRQTVDESTNQKQLPWEGSSIIGEFVFNPTEGRLDLPLTRKPIVEVSSPTSPITPIPSRPKPVDSTNELPVPLTRSVVVIDPGHGGPDPGAIGINNIYEKEIVLDIGIQVARLLEKQGVTVIMTRTTDIDLDLQPRVDIAEQSNAKIFISLHANNISMTRPDVNGLETYYYDSGAGLAQSVHQSILEDVPIVDRRVRQARFFVIRKTSMPAIIVETGFVTGADDSRNFQNASFRQAMAKGIARGILRYLRTG
jgi:N-acetylmuramoyl-L-alanine amidase